ncbi:hypothetical protein [Streptomyces xylophagus]|uniref:hypothetical protein n=1 Tax=Streptomyces xylophagus TaxID=285514 RepID=UPI00131EAC73|nr:hypothetical protein [Streptomyces xylophagus]
MTSHAMTLPGEGRVAEPGTTDCRGHRCFTVVGPALRGDTIAAWHATLKGGAEAMDIYLATYNAQFAHKHGASCAFRYLPPSIHVACKESYETLQAESELANRARFEFNR